MKKILLWLTLLSFGQHIFAQCSNEKAATDYPFTQNGITVTLAGSGSSQTYSYGSYQNCGVTLKNNSTWLGQTGPGSLTNTFSSGVNDVIYNFAGSDPGEVFTITVNNGTPTVSDAGGSCGSNYTISGNVLTVVSSSTGGMFKVHSTQPYTSLTISHNGTGSGTIFTMCADSFITSASITNTGTLSALTTQYGTASATGTFSVAATGLTAGILVTAPTGFEVSTNATTGFGGTVTIPGSGTIASTPVYIRLAATTVVGSYSGDVVLSSTGVSDVHVATVSSTVTPAPLTITAVNQTKVYGAANPTLTATYTGFVNGDTNSSLTTQPTITTTGTASSAVGSYPITATGAASSNYTITYVAGTLTVTKAPLIITAVNQTKVYGAALPTLTATYNGFVNGDTFAGLTTQPTVTTTGTASSAVGTYPITAAGAASANYNITYNAGTLTVTTANLTIAASNATKVYGAANPTLAVTYTGFVNGDTNASLTTPPTISTTATASSPVGSYPITATGAASANYSISYTAATLTVTQAPLVITANNISRNYGQPNPTLTVTYTGLVNGDTNASLSTQPTITTTATITSLPGTYPITASGAAGSNYSISYVAGIFRVIPLTNANLSNLTISNGILSPTFATGTFSYTTSVANSVSNVTVIPTADPTATVLVNGLPATNGAPFSVDLSIGNNTIAVLVTAQDGTTKLTYTITVYRAVPPDAVFATNILTPNGDGKNDTWIIKDILLYPNNTVKVFDRAGRIVFAQHSYANTWDGTLSGSPLTEGTYYYAIDLGIFGAQPIKGYVSILRKR